MHPCLPTPATASLLQLVSHTSARTRIMAAAAATVSGAAAVATPLATLFQSPHVVGVTWMLSSALLTTYSTNHFLKYNAQPPTLQGKAAQRGSRSMGKSVAATSPTTATRLPRVLATMSRPTLLTLSRFGGSLLLGLLAHTDGAVVTRLVETVAAARHFWLPAFFLFIANYANSISLDRIGISLTYTSKCGIPLMTVLLTLLSGHALPNPLALLSLLPIALGIAAASWNSPTFEKYGFLAALVSTLAQSALNVSSKTAITKTGIRGPDAQRAMVAVGLGLALCSTALVMLFSSRNDPADVEYHPPLPPAWLGSAAVVAYHIEYVLSFMFVRLVAPITYGTCDAMRRLSIILSGRVMFGGAPLTRINLFGIGLALLGALSYSITSTLAL